MGMKYVPDRKGTRELAQTTGVGNACLRAAEMVKSAASSLPITGASQQQIASYRAAFRASRKPVRMERSGEVRAGAVVSNDDSNEAWIGGRNRTLYTAVEATDGVVIK